MASNDKEQHSTLERKLHVSHKRPPAGYSVLQARGVLANHTTVTPLAAPRVSSALNSQVNITQRSVNDNTGQVTTHQRATVASGHTKTG